MTKKSLFATSLLAALPAAFLCYLMVQAFLQRAEAMKSMFLVLAGTTLGICGLLLLMPFGILIFAKGAGGSTAKKPKKDKKKAKGKVAAAAVDDEDALDTDADLADELADGDDWDAEADDDFGQSAAFEQAESTFEADGDIDELAIETEYDGLEAFDEGTDDDEFEEADVDLDNFDDFEFEDDDEDEK